MKYVAKILVAWLIMSVYMLGYIAWLGQSVHWPSYLCAIGICVIGAPLARWLPK